MGLGHNVQKHNTTGREIIIFRAMAPHKKQKAGNSVLCNAKAVFFLPSPKKEAKAYHRITESQNSRGWKGPLWVI